MAITVGENCHRQVEESISVDNNGNKNRRVIYKGPIGEIEAMAATLKVGTNFALGWDVTSWDISRQPASQALLTITVNKVDESDEGESGESESGETVALDETWTLKSVRNDISILAYCGPSSDHPRREDIEAWQKEPDGQLAKNLSYRLPSGLVYEINSQSSTAALIKKIRNGVDSVMRFYPMLTKTRTFAGMPAQVFENLAYIDTPSVSTALTAKKIRKPGSLAAIIAAHEWLKCQDDLTALGGEKFQRVESWMGIAKTGMSKGWDANFYGADGSRWPIPLNSSAANGNTSAN